MANGTPAAEQAIDQTLVRMLIIDQHPDFGILPIELLESGWDNVMFRLGEQYLVRMPRRLAAATLIRHEQQWLPSLAPQLPLPIPAPLRIGQPGRTFPWYWSIVPWFEGTPADQHPLAPDQALRLAHFLRALHQPAPAHAPANPVRGGQLTQRAPYVEPRLKRIAQQTTLITATIWQQWHQACATPLDCPPGWLHGDLHPRNIIVNQGRISAIIDWGDITAGDPATDLAAAWMVCPNDIPIFMSTYQASAATQQRAIGWAIALASALLDSGLVDNPRNAAIGAATLRAIDSCSNSQQRVA